MLGNLMEDIENAPCQTEGTITFGLCKSRSCNEDDVGRWETIDSNGKPVSTGGL